MYECVSGVCVCVVCVYECVGCVCVHACACVFVGCCLATKTLNLINTKRMGGGNNGYGSGLLGVTSNK